VRQYGSLVRMRCALLLVILCAFAACSLPNSLTAVPPSSGNAAGSQALQLDGDLLPTRAIAFTYDDGPDVATMTLAQLLHDEGIRATFFVNGCNFIGHTPERCGQRTQVPESILEDLVALGHRVANHSEHHHNLVVEKLPKAKIQQEFLLTQRMLATVQYDGVSLFRPPNNAWTEQAQQAFLVSPQLAKLQGPIKYDDHGGDWGCTDPKVWNPPLSPDRCAEEYLKSQSKLENGIFQMHDRNPSLPGTDYVVQLTRALLWRLRNTDGLAYRFVPLDAIPGIHSNLTLEPPTRVSPALSDSDGWQAPTRWSSIRWGDVDGDGLPDACGRADGIVCVLSSTSQQMADHTAVWLARDISVPVQDALELGDVDGDGLADLFVRGPDGAEVHLSTGHSFDREIWQVPDLDDASGWGMSESRWGSLRLGDLNNDGRADVCGRSEKGIFCALSGPAGFGPLTLVLEELTDAQGWDRPEFGSTLRLGDIDGDKQADLCARGHEGVYCALSHGSDFGPLKLFTQAAFEDASGWGANRAAWGSIHLGDIDGDGRADLCGRIDTGMACALSTGQAFSGFRYVINTAFGDGTGWGQASSGATIRLVDFDADGHADVCGRSRSGLVCARSTGLSAPKRQ